MSGGQSEIKQIIGLDTSLDTKAETASNIGATGVGLFKQKTVTNFEFFKIGVDGSVVPDSAASDIVQLQLNIDNISDILAEKPNDLDTVAVFDQSTGLQKKITVANFHLDLDAPVKIGDYATGTSVDADSGIFFDASDSDTPKIETKSSYLSEHAKLNSPTFTGLPLAPTASTSTENTQIATTAFVHAVQTAASAGFAFLDEAIDIQVDGTLDPSPATTGDRYIIESASTINAGFGTIDKDTEGNATVLGDDDVVEFDGTDFVILFYYMFL